jgi:hypothetical protein
MQHLLKIIAFSLLFPCCEKIGDAAAPSRDPEQNFQHLWQVIKNKYSFFEHKRIDWDSVYHVYQPQIRKEMSDTELFAVLAAMMNELRDGHVNLYSSFNVSRYLPVFYNSPENYDRAVVMRHYLGAHFYTTGPFLHSWVGDSQVAYVHYGSFSSSFSAQQLTFISERYSGAKGLILDLRNNGGGAVSNMLRLAAAVADTRRHVYTTYVKNGPGPADFKKSADFFIDPAGIPLHEKIVVLTNRNSYSASSYFASCMKAFPHVMLLGDTTGGGTGAPTGGELPNGWGYRFSGTYSLTALGHNYEDGVPPDTVVWLNPASLLAGKDDMIEAAIDYLK